MKPEESDTSTIPGSLPHSGDAQAFVSELIRTFPRDAAFSAQKIVERHPHLAGHRSCLIDLAYEEFCRLREAGDDVSATQFAGQYRDIEHSLHRVIEFDQIIHQHPSFISSIPDEQWPVPGNSFCGLQLIELIGRGVLSRVFLARQSRLGNRHTVAKICARGEQEANLLGKLNHPAIAGVYSIDTHPGSGLSVICMPYVTRATLHHVAELLRTSELRKPLGEDVSNIVHRINADDASFAENQRTLPVAVRRAALGELILRWGETLADALQFAHEGDILHCDVKPGNVLVLPDLSVQLLDFNLASTATGGDRILGGTMPYMASEQLLHLLQQGLKTPPADQAHDDNLRASAATDVFGLCATLWHLATGHPPFGVGTDSANRITAAQEVLTRQQQGVKPESHELQTFEVPAEVLQVLAKGLNAERHARPGTAGELAAQFKMVRESLYPAEQQHPIVLSESRATQFRRRMIGLTALAALLCGGLYYALTPPQRANPGPTELQTLLTTGQLDAAADLLAGQLDLDPENDPLRYELGLLLLRQKYFARAAEVLNPERSAAVTDASGQHPGLAFLRLYLRTIEAKIPNGMPETSGVHFADSPAMVEAEFKAERRTATELEGLLEAWQLLADGNEADADHPLSITARVNAACVALELQNPQGSQECIDRLPAQVRQWPAVQRVCNVLEILEALHTRSPVPEIPMRQMQSLPRTQLTRSESRALLMALVSRMTAPGVAVLTEATAGAESMQQFETAISELIPAHVEASCLRYVLHQPEFRNHRLLVQRISQTVSESVSESAGEIRNHLEHLLVLPPAAGADLGPDSTPDTRRTEMAAR